MMTDTAMSSAGSLKTLIFEIRTATVCSCVWLVSFKWNVFVSSLVFLLSHVPQTFILSGSVMAKALSEAQAGHHAWRLTLLWWRSSRL